MSSKSLLRQARWQRLLSFAKELLARREALIAIIILSFSGCIIIIAPWLATQNPLAINLAARLQPPSLTHFCGTDELGRDIWSRILYGGRMTFLGVAITAGLTAPMGLLLGMLAGYVGGIADLVISRVIDLFFAIPRLILALVFVAILGPGLLNAALAVALTSWPIYARIARAETLTLRNAEFIQAAELQGAGVWRILRRYMFPMCLSSLLIRLSLDLGGIILSIAGIGFLGLGAQPPTPEWGNMAAQGRTYLLNQWWVSVMPGLAIFTVTLCFNIIGEAIRDLLDPKREAVCH